MATLQDELHFWFYYVATKPGVIEYRSCEGTDCLKVALCSGVSSFHVVVASTGSVNRRSNEVETLLYLEPWPIWRT